jgi:hypothetical protein
VQLRSRHRWVRVGRIAAVLSSLAFASPACQHYIPKKQSEVAQGRYYSSGNPEYDEFFLSVYHLQVGLKDGPDSVARAKTALGERLGLDKDAGLQALRAALAERLSALSSRGVTLKLERDVGGRSKLATTGSPSPQDAEFTEALAQTVDAVSLVRTKVGDWTRDLDRLPTRGLELEQNVDATFRLSGFGKNDEVRENLADAQKVMALMRPLLKDVDTQSMELSDVVNGVLGASAAPPPPPEPEPAAEPEPPKPTRRASPPRRAAPPPAPPPKEADAPKPPPKPAAGPAKPDFEP